LADSSPYHGNDGRGQPDEDREHVCGEDRPELGALGPQLVVRFAGRVEVLASGIPVEGGEEQPDRQEREAVRSRWMKGDVQYQQGAAMANTPSLNASIREARSDRGMANTVRSSRVALTESSAASFVRA
jgi:hypothetical protein